MAEFTQEAVPTDGRGPVRAGKLVNAAGAIVSLGLIAGIGVWGYNLVMRDVTGVPVVRAMDGPMRIAPNNPGGEVSLNTGLAVNEVAAEGAAAGPEDMVMLAPPVVDLADEDFNVMPTAEANEVLPDPAIPEADTSETEVAVAFPVPASDTSLTAEQILALADQIAGNVPAGTGAEAEVMTASLEERDAAPETITDIIATSVPGVVSSLRPVPRPAALNTAPPPAPVTAALGAIDPALLITSKDIPLGTNLVQLGAFDSAEIAASEWLRLNGRFTDYMAGKERIIQEASRGGRTFFRLRALGFSDLSDARRFCAALMAENTDCVPVVVR